MKNLRRTKKASREALGLSRAEFAVLRRLSSPQKIQAFLNGLGQNFELKGETLYIGKPSYKPYDQAAIKLQAHGDPSQPISFRNIWVRPLD